MVAVRGSAQTSRVYGGVRVDAENASQCADRAFGSRPDARGLDLMYASFSVLDMPLSATADTLLLPMTIPHSQNVASDVAPQEVRPLPLASTPPPDAEK